MPILGCLVVGVALTIAALVGAISAAGSSLRHAEDEEARRRGCWGGGR